MSKKPIPTKIKKVLGETLYVERKISNITSGWARNSNWDARMCARDLFQNFFDGATEAGKPISDISGESLDKDTFAFYLADVTFDVRRLFYLGSEKDGVNTIGQVGEGFKLATLTLLRDFNVRVFAASGEHMLEMSLSDDVIEQKINLYPLQYDYYKLATPCNGNYLFIHGANKELISALESSRFEFFYPEHPALGLKLGISSREIDIFERTDSAFGIYTDTKDGLVFYHNQLRAVLPKANVVIVIKKRWKLIDNKIGQDRDRTFFGDKLKDTLLRLAVGCLEKNWEFGDIHGLLGVSKDSLPKGNSFLAAFAMHARFGFHDDFLEELREGHLGKVYGMPNDYSLRAPLVMAKVKELEADGYIGVPRYMCYFGAKDPLELIKNDKKKLAMEVKESGSRQPTDIEFRLIAECFSLVPKVSDRAEYEFHIFASRQLLGQYRDNNESGHYRRTKQVYLSQDIFTDTPGELVSTILHEVSHIVGYDGSRDFTDQLTSIIGLIIDQHGKVGNKLENIKRLMDEVKNERIANNANLSAIQDFLQRKNPDEMSRVLSKVPFDILNGIIGEAVKAN